MCTRTQDGCTWCRRVIQVHYGVFCSDRIDLSKRGFLALLLDNIEPMALRYQMVKFMVEYCSSQICLNMYPLQHRTSLAKLNLLL